MDENIFQKRRLSRSFLGHEKRYLPRWYVANTAEYALDASSPLRSCKTVDISCSGACLNVSEILMPGQPLNMTIHLDEERQVNVHGKVVWNKISEDQRLAGIEFFEIEPEDQELILDYAFEISPDDLVQHWFEGWEK
ncbi:MAG TPA: PilZ domain-containing protein [Candidatus Omnitrophota bacterium]|nr:PilZ domain-containing protein [Candidatus Omnitrophota bacterium]HSA31813.1 PilZ domain-containing protein [Candidatus Omnitrophota bacterium]